MLAIQHGKENQGQCVPNILPCRISHNGRVNTSKRYWAPMQLKDGKTVAYFRGRKLHGKSVKVPGGYKGVVLSLSAKTAPKESQGEEEQDEEIIEVGSMEQNAQFGEVMVWGHEVLPDNAGDPYVKGMEEWMAFAEQIHSHASDTTEYSRSA